MKYPKSYLLISLIVPLTLLTSCNKGNYSLTRKLTEGTSLEFETCSVTSEGKDYVYSRIEVKVNIEGSIQISKENFEAISSSNGKFNCMGILSDRTIDPTPTFATFNDIYESGPTAKEMSLGIAFDTSLEAIKGATVKYQNTTLKIDKSIGFN